MSNSVRVLSFPGDEPFGTLTWGEGTVQPAVGDVAVPGTAEVRLHLSRYGLRKSSSLTKFDPAEFLEISVRKNVGIGMQEFLPNLNHFAGIRRLDLGDNPTIKDEHLGFLASFLSLKVLKLDYTRVTGDGLLPHVNVHPLNELAIGPHATGVIRPYTDLLSLQRLDLDGPGCSAILESGNQVGLPPRL